MIGLVAIAMVTAPVVWSTPPISSDRFESHPAFDPRTGDLWFVRSTPRFSGWRIKVSRCEKTGQSAPTDAPIASDGVEADPWFSPDGGEIGAAFSPSGKSWLFARDMKDGRSGELLLAGEQEGWPKPCPRAAPD